MRKWLGLCLIVILILCPSLAHARGTELDNRDFDAYLLSAGYPQYVISKLDTDLKLELYRENAEFVRFEEGNPLLRETVGPDQGQLGIKAIGHYHEWYLYSSVSAPTGYTRFKVTYSWSWLFAPFMCLTDKVAVAWSDGWASVPNTSNWKYQAWRGTKCYQWDGTNVTSPSVTSKSYSFNILSWYDGDSIDSHSGWLSTTVQHPTGTGVGQIAVLGRYFHQTFSLDGSISASGEPSLSITPTWAYDWSQGEADLYQFKW